MTTLEEVFIKVNGDDETQAIEPGTDEFFEQKANEERGQSLNNK